MSKELPKPKQDPPDLALLSPRELAGGDSDLRLPSNGSGSGGPSSTSNRTCSSTIVGGGGGGGGEEREEAIDKKKLHTPNSSTSIADRLAVDLIGEQAGPASAAPAESKIEQRDSRKARESLPSAISSPDTISKKEASRVTTTRRGDTSKAKGGDKSNHRDLYDTNSSTKTGLERADRSTDKKGVLNPMTAASKKNHNDEDQANGNEDGDDTFSTSSVVDHADGSSSGSTSREPSCPPPLRSALGSGSAELIGAKTASTAAAANTVKSSAVPMSDALLLGLTNGSELAPAQQNEGAAATTTARGNLIPVAEPRAPIFGTSNAPYSRSAQHSTLSDHSVPQLTVAGNFGKESTQQNTDTHNTATAKGVTPMGSANTDLSIASPITSPPNALNASVNEGLVLLNLNARSKGLSANPTLTPSLSPSLASGSPNLASTSASPVSHRRKNHDGSYNKLSITLAKSPSPPASSLPLKGENPEESRGHLGGGGGGVGKKAFAGSSNNNNNNNEDNNAGIADHSKLNHDRLTSSSSPALTGGGVSLLAGGGPSSGGNGGGSVFIGSPALAFGGTGAVLGNSGFVGGLGGGGGSSRFASPLLARTQSAQDSYLTVIDHGINEDDISNLLSFASRENTGVAIFGTSANNNHNNTNNNPSFTWLEQPNGKISTNNGIRGEANTTPMAATPPANTSPGWVPSALKAPTTGAHHSRSNSKRINFSDSVQVAAPPASHLLLDSGESATINNRGSGQFLCSGRGDACTRAPSMVNNARQVGLTSIAAPNGVGGPTSSSVFGASPTSPSVGLGYVGTHFALPSMAAPVALGGAAVRQPYDTNQGAKKPVAIGSAAKARGYTFSGNTLKRIAVDNDDEDNDDDTFLESLVPTFCKTIKKKDGTVETLWMRLKKLARRFLYISFVFLGLSLTDAKRRKGSFCLGLGSVVVVVFIAAVLFTTLSNMDMIFLKLGEAERGEMDVVLTAGGQVSDANSLNYSVVLDNLKLFGIGETSFHAARISVTTSKFFSPWSSPRSPGYCLFPPLELLPESERSTKNVANYLWTNSTQRWTGETTNANDCENAECTVITMCPTIRRIVSGDLHWIDFEREKRMGLGRRFPTEFLPLEDDECVIDDAMARSLGVNVGDQFVAVVEGSYPFMEAYQKAGLDDLNGVFETTPPAYEPLYTSNPVSVVTLRVRAIVTDSYGKLGNDADFFVFANYRSAAKQVGQGLSTEKSTQAQRDTFAEVDPNTCASRIIFNFPPDVRTQEYIKDGYEGARTYGLDFAGRIVTPIGFNQVACRLPLVSYLYDFRFFSMFLSLLIWMIIAALAFLSVVLIYSLLTVNIESRTYELGVMRMEGFPRHTLTGLVVVGALLFAIPGWAVGLVIGQCAYLGIRVLLVSLTQTEMTAQLSGSAIGWATLAGIGIPLLASLAPVLSILTQSLPDALNTERGRTKAVDYRVEGASDSYFSWTISFLGVVLTLFGFLIYYLFPKSLLNSDLALMLVIFFIVLIMLLGGLILLTVNFQRFVETIVQYVFLFWEHGAVFLLVERNLTAHRPRNRKSTLMFALSLGFIIFISVAFDIQFISITYEDERSIGGDLLIGLNNMPFSSFTRVDALLQEMKRSGLVEAYAYNTEEFKAQHGIADSSINTVGRYRDANPVIRAVSPTFFESTDDTFLIIKDQDASSGLSLGERLYTLQGSGELILPTSYISLLALDNLNDPYELYLTYDEGNDFLNGRNGTRAEVRISFATTAFLSASAVLAFSKYPQDGLLGGIGGGAALDAAMSITAMIGHSQNKIKTVRTIRWNVMSVSTFKNKEKASVAAAALEDLFADLGYGSVSNVHEQSQDFETAKNILNFFFYFTQIMATAICFFALLSSMSTNILHQAKEIGVLRCLGLRVFATYRLYLWESFIVVLAASLMGLVVGTIVAYTMLLQNSLFTQLPLPFTFPYVQLGIIAATSVLCAFFASYGPVKALMSLPSITHILRRTV